jgi:uncharacterized membrane protein
MQTVEPRRIVALAFDSREAARDALGSALRLESDEITVHDAVLVARDREGHVEVATREDPFPVAAAVPCCLVGAVAGAVLAGPLGFLVGGAVGGGGGALVARLVQAAIPHRVIGELRKLARPGKTVIALLVSRR